MATNNAINLKSAGIVSYDGAGIFTGLADPLIVSHGGSGVNSHVAYAPIVGGTTSTNPNQSVNVGSTGQVLQSQGNAAIPAYSTATYPATAGTSGNVLTSDGTNWTSAPAASGSVIAFTKFTSTQTWTKNTRTKIVQIIAWGGGGSGGSGGTSTSTTGSSGGNGGGGGGFCSYQVDASFFPSSCTVTIAATANGVAGVSTSSSGGTAGNDGNSSLVDTFTIDGGAHGPAGRNGNGAFITLGGSRFSNTSYSAPNGLAGSVNNGSIIAGDLTSPAKTAFFSVLQGQPTAGGGGGNRTTTPTTGVGGAGGDIQDVLLVTKVAGGTAGNAASPTTTGTGGQGGAGNAPTSVEYIFGGTGGGGGGCGGTTSGTGGAGNNGGIPGGGGGGGGSCTNGSTSGASGNGARGEVWIIEF